MIDISIKLNYFKDFPFKEIKELMEESFNNYMPITVLKMMVINYLYMFPTSISEKQKICALLGISVQFQQIIDNKSTQKLIK